MGFIDKIKDFMTVPDDDFDDEHNLDFVDNTDDLFTAPMQNSAKDKKIVDINSSMPAHLQVVLVKPDRFDDASEIADHLNQKRTVVLNLESTSKEVSRRLIDFLSGVAYANNGEIKRVANSTFIITPYNVNVMGELMDEIESNNMF